MQANPQKKLGDDAFAETDGRPPFPFRTAVSLVLLAGNLVVAAIYFHILNP
jgi:photosystem I 4.8kDa protein